MADSYKYDYYKTVPDPAEKINLDAIRMLPTEEFEMLYDYSVAV